MNGADVADVMETSQPMELHDLCNSGSVREHNQEQHHPIDTKDDFTTARLQLTLVNKFSVVTH